MSEDLFSGIARNNILSVHIEDYTNMQEPTMNGFTPFLWAAKLKSNYMALFERNGSKLDAVDNNGNNVIHIFAENNDVTNYKEFSFSNPDLSKTLLLKFNSKGELPIHTAFREKNYAIAKEFLLINSSLINAQDFNGCAPIFYAIQNEDCCFFNLLLSFKDIDLSVAFNGETVEDALKGKSPALNKIFEFYQIENQTYVEDTVEISILGGESSEGWLIVCSDQFDSEQSPDPVKNPEPTPSPVEKPISTQAPVEKSEPAPAPAKKPKPTPPTFNKSMQIQTPIEKSKSAPTQVEKPIPTTSPVEKPIPTPSPAEKPEPVPAPAKKSKPIQTPVEKPKQIPAPVKKSEPTPFSVKKSEPVPTSVEKPDSIPAQIENPSKSLSISQKKPKRFPSPVEKLKKVEASVEIPPRSHSIPPEKLNDNRTNSKQESVPSKETEDENKISNFIRMCIKNDNPNPIVEKYCIPKWIKFALEKALASNMRHSVAVLAFHAKRLRVKIGKGGVNIPKDCNAECLAQLISNGYKLISKGQIKKIEGYYNAMNECLKKFNNDAFNRSGPFMTQICIRFAACTALHNVIKENVANIDFCERNHGQTLLMNSIRTGDSDFVKYVLQHSIDSINYKNGIGETAYDIAVRIGNAEIANLIKEAMDKSDTK